LNNKPVPEPGTHSQIIFYQSENGKSRIEVRLEEGTVWLTQALITELYQTTKQNVSLHIRNIFTDRELEEGSVVKEYLTTAADSKSYRTSPPPQNLHSFISHVPPQTRKTFRPSIDAISGYFRLLYASLQSERRKN